MKILSTRIWGFLLGLKSQNANFLEKVYNDFDEILVTDAQYNHE
jgi:hypothetical protein